MRCLGVLTLLLAAPIAAFSTGFSTPAATVLRRSAFTTAQAPLSLPLLRSSPSCQRHRTSVGSTKSSYSVTRMSGGSGSDKALAVVVYVSVKPGTEQAFIEASLNNAKNSVQEEGIARFDFIQNKEDPTKFVLVEVYKTDDAGAKHKETAHYAAWRDTVADMMAEPRSASKYKNIFPGSFGDWDVPADLMKGSAESGKDELLAVHVFVHVTEGAEQKFIDASLANAMNSVKEPGVARFDVLQDTENPRKFCLVEVYSNPDAPAAHKETAHYAAWRDAVADIMAEPRSALKYANIFPAKDGAWRSSKL
mmetsp:Transcript_16183/g.39437  ORF Transcript_16183/g.39437 Transcript_16183/m.39437 type:complete len:307 (-) Transcript_16183:134-1054(-)|eukprot:CAMPEP_0206236074 /NCGR_PEP_ID=MMETSP0047_2-20121206/13505_1 /ASSEMBLY_ACC=CAM_ASM_000192 /TAXON_ID=195065 /ORGANISM="Chroomonas mesostigmatica_cf, Strain CCMP1168" /LENGTH=306 /DNA_ID=CAMNT_0053660353 /DNA_START=20 /DNA_END=940 /DNA_ORIENTATION=-